MNSGHVISLGEEIPGTPTPFTHMYYTFQILYAGSKQRQWESFESDQREILLGMEVTHHNSQWRIKNS